MKSIQPKFATTVSTSRRVLTERAGGNWRSGVVLFALVALVGAGCQTSPFATSTASAVASITVANRPLPAVALATDTVFLRHGFSGGRTGKDEFTYSHAGSRTIQLANGGLRERINERLVVTLKPYGDTVTVTCSAHWVDGPGEAGLTKRSLAGQPYQDLLNDIETRLK